MVGDFPSIISREGLVFSLDLEMKLISSYCAKTSSCLVMIWVKVNDRTPIFVLLLLFLVNAMSA